MTSCSSLLHDTRIIIHYARMNLRDYVAFPYIFHFLFIYKFGRPVRFIVIQEDTALSSGGVPGDTLCSAVYHFNYPR